VVEPDDAANPRPLDLRLAFQLHTEFGEERFCSLEVVDDDENVVHSLNRHIVVSWCRGPRLSWPSPDERSPSELLDMEASIELTSRSGISWRRCDLQIVLP